jgi:hypothetical protein
MSLLESPGTVVKFKDQHGDRTEGPYYRTMPIRSASRILALIASTAVVCGCAGSRSAQNNTQSPAASPVASAVVPTASPTSPASLASSSGLAGSGLLVPPAGRAYQLLLGPSVIDDGLPSGLSTMSSTSTSLKNGIASAFGDAAPPPPDQAPSVAAARALLAKIPESEYDLAALAKTLPDDPLALEHFVRDQIALDGYDGIMRGPLGVWLSRAGGPDDKVSFLAWLLLEKGVAFQFVRGTLSDDELGRLARAIGKPVAPAAYPPPIAKYVASRVHDGTTFAAWAQGVLAANNVSLGETSSAPSMRRAHYWIQIARDGALFDLDPTLAGTTDGAHFGTTDPTFEPSAVLPAALWHKLQVRLLETSADGSIKTLLDDTDTVANLAYAPIRFTIAPTTGDPAKPAGTAFSASLTVGSLPATKVSFDTSDAARGLAIEVRRTGIDGSVAPIARRTLLDTSVSASNRPDRLAGLTTILVAPGRGSTAFTLHEQMTALVTLAKDVAASAAGKTPEPHAWYPLRIADYFSRDDAVGDALANAANTRFFRDRPNVAMQRTWFASAANGDATAVTAFDIADNGMGTGGAASGTIAAANVARGYADTELERDVSESPSNYGTIALFAAAGSAAPRVLASLAPADASEPLHAGLDQTFAAGQVALSPSGPVTIDGNPAFGWWALDPKSGNTIGRMTGGSGQDMGEYSVTLNTISKAYTLYGQLQTGATCSRSGLGSAACAAAICASIISYPFGGGTVPALAANYGAGELATAGCSGGFGAK